MKSDLLKLGDVAFDPATRALTFDDGRTAQLRNKSKEVLIYLLENANTTVTKNALLTAVWSDVIASDESLVQCIADIRRIIGPDARQIVETVPRKGYRLNLAEPQPALSRRSWPLAAAAVAAVLIAGVIWTTAPLSQGNAPQSTTIAAAQTPPGTTNTEAYLEVLKGRVSATHFDLDDSLTAERHFRRAVELDPDYARAFAELGTLFAVRFENDWTVLDEADKQKALYFAERAVALEPEMWLGHYALGRLHSVLSDFDAAEEHLQTAMSLEPDNEDARAYLGVVHIFKGDPETAAAILGQAVASHPDAPFWYYFALGHAQFNLQQFVEAEDNLLRCLELAPNSPYCLRYLMAVYGVTGNLTKAEKAVTSYAAMGFDPSVKAIVALVPFHHADDRAQLEWALRKTGLND